MGREKRYVDVDTGWFDTPVRKFDPDQARDEAGRWTSGTGFDVITARPGDLPTTPPLTAERTREVAEKVLGRLGIPGEKLKIVEGRGPDFDVGGQAFKEAGHYDPTTGEVTLFNGGFYNDSDVLALAAHEGQHHVFHEMERAAKEESDAIVAERERLKAEGKDWYDTMYRSPADDRLRDEYAERFPIAQMWAEWREKATAGAEDPHYGRASDAAARFSSYAASYWTAWKAGNMQTDRAINESLAEVARSKALGLQVPRVWSGLYNEMTRLYRLRMRSR